MSERLPQSGEQHGQHNETAGAAEKPKHSAEALKSAERQQQVLRNQAEKLTSALAKSNEDINVNQFGESKDQVSHTFGVHKELKLQNYKRLLRHVQSRLTGPEKSFSKIIHSSQVDQVSRVGAKTVARPWGILVGGLVTFVGSLIVLILARRSGFSYNFSLFILLFAAGYLIGTLLEGLGKLVNRRR